MRAGGPLALALAAIVLVACEPVRHPPPGQQLGVLKRGEAQARILVMPVDAELFELTVGGVREPKAEWTSSARTLLSAEMRQTMQTRNVAAVDYEDAAVAPEKRDHFRQLIMLHAVVGFGRWLEQYLPDAIPPTRKSQGAWTLGPDVRDLKDQYGANYALFTYVRDSYSSTGRVITSILAAGVGIHVSGGTQIGFASLVDLDTGDLVWFNALGRHSGDVRDADGARETMAALLTDFPK